MSIPSEHGLYVCRYCHEEDKCFTKCEIYHSDSFYSKCDICGIKAPLMMCFAYKKVLSSPTKAKSKGGNV